LDAVAAALFAAFVQAVMPECANKKFVSAAVMVIALVRPACER
jgi:hypothetical protein